MFLLFRLLCLLIVLPASTLVFAQEERDSLWVTSRNDKWYVVHHVKSGEDIFSLSRRYNVPPAVLADANSINYQAALHENSDIYIPLGRYNQVSAEPQSQQVRKLYYQVAENDNLFRISHYAGVQQKTMQRWNNLADNSIAPGDVLFIGWVLYKDATSPVVNKNIPPQQIFDRRKKKKNSDTVIVIRKSPLDTLSDEEKQYLSQTQNETAVTEEKGSAVFFGSSGKIKGTQMYFAFHNTAPKGTVIKVYNPGTDKTVYVKVLGPIPETKQYHNSIIGIGAGAKRTLGVTGERTWCELKYAP